MWMKLNSVLKGRDHFYIMHLSYGNEGKRTIPTIERLWNIAKKKNRIGLSHYLVEGFWNDEGVPELALTKGLPPKWRSQFDIFYNQMGKHDIVVILSGQDSILGVAKVTEEKPKYDLKLEGKFFSHYREISWERDYDFDERLMITPVKGFVNSLDRVKQGTERWANLMTVKLP